ncbi:MAG: cardiolipin synthase [Desulfitobacteriaceae bacterium]|nr:cardiolipin synthase [Desulfitobacteriaceae bacterium]MDD4345477.1 cardiolipin synthase [Desulfitobacteriaceae bacterium]MDD4400675.1 cardiolipin synthase [Desulfitobacteriaceae bacterium]
MITLLQLLLLGTVIFFENRDPARTIVWLLVLGALPVIGALLYLVFGRVVRKRRLFRTRHYGKNRLEEILQNRHNVPTVDDDISQEGALTHKTKLNKLLLRNNLAPLTVDNNSKVLTNGEETFEAIFAALHTAKNHIHLEYYIFKDDNVGRDMQNILIKKAGEGIRVRVLLDGLGSIPMSKRVHQLRKAGVETEWFAPIRFPFLTSRLNLRNHRKIIVVDGQVGFIGGLNIGDEYLSRSKRFGFWRDTFLKLEGESVHLLQKVFLRDWFYASRKKIHGRSYFPKPKPAGDQLVQIAASGPDSDWEAIPQVIFISIAGAEKYIYIETPYFIPDESTLMSLKTAALSGLDVRIITQGIPDHKLTYWASRSYFELLLAAGARIYKYNKGILHAKVLIVDGQLGSVGSTNFDTRSFRLNFEISAFIYHRDLAMRLEKDFYQDLENSEEIILGQFVERPWTDKFKESSARLLSPIL